MLLESVLSCSYLLLTCGSCIYTLIKHSYDQYHKLLPHVLCACNGIVMIGARSLFVLVYKLFFKEYAFDPVIIEFEEKKNKGKCNMLDEILGTLGVTSLIYSSYCHHKYYVLGACIITSFTILDVVQLSRTRTTQLQELDTLQLNINSSQIMHMSRTTILIEVLVSGHFAYLVGNSYALMATYPYFLTTWALTPEGFYQTWTIERTINDYMMMAYVVCMAEALRQISRP
ncbi:uncharacterized protein LOC116425489 [Nomia melanderi]|uniref:uncharacterized protein LOC116425489 n=1 Tax=Nomia melanderi TaxID=2448451 RepID=UPI00130409CF|nr:uncharacterized protein LOC116425489 [Nomia melanderi]